MQTKEPVSTREYTERLVKNLDSTYAKDDLEQVADNVTKPNSDERTQLLGLLQYFEDFFDGTFRDWYTEPVKLELNPDYKQFNCKYYTVPIINKEIFHK